MIYRLAEKTLNKDKERVWFQDKINSRKLEGEDECQIATFLGDSVISKAKDYRISKKLDTKTCKLDELDVIKSKLCTW